MTSFGTTVPFSNQLPSACFKTLEQMILLFLDYEVSYVITNKLILTNLILKVNIFTF